MTTVGRLRVWSPRSYARVISLCVMLFGANGIASAQELTPRAYWPAPYGTKLVGLGYAHSTGDIVTDPSLPLVGVDSTIDTAVVFYQQTISLAGRTSNIQIEVPYTDGTTKGAFEGQPAQANVSGVGDVTATIGVNLVGAPSMTREEFQAFRQNPKPVLATSLRVVAPTGEYNPDKLINVGTNRWAAKIKLGYLYPLPKRTVLELGAGVWFFEDNDEFLGTTREQQPLTAFDVHLVKRFRPGFWGSIDANYYFGGRTTVGGTKRADFQRNSRLGASLVYPFGSRHAFKVSVNAGVVTESGGDYNTYILNYIYRLD